MRDNTKAFGILRPGPGRKKIAYILDRNKKKDDLLWILTATNQVALSEFV